MNSFWAWPIFAGKKTVSDFFWPIHSGSELPSGKCAVAPCTLMCFNLACRRDGFLSLLPRSVSSWTRHSRWALLLRRGCRTVNGCKCSPPPARATPVFAVSGCVVFSLSFLFSSFFKFMGFCCCGCKWLLSQLRAAVARGFVESCPVTISVIAVAVILPPILLFALCFRAIQSEKAAPGQASSLFRDSLVFPCAAWNGFPTKHGSP